MTDVQQIEENVIDLDKAVEDFATATLRRNAISGKLAELRGVYTNVVKHLELLADLNAELERVMKLEKKAKKAYTETAKVLRDAIPANWDGNDKQIYDDALQVKEYADSLILYDEVEAIKWLFEQFKGDPASFQDRFFTFIRPNEKVFQDTISKQLFNIPDDVVLFGTKLGGAIVDEEHLLNYASIDIADVESDEGLPDAGVYKQRLASLLDALKSENPTEQVPVVDVDPKYDVNVSETSAKQHNGNWGDVPF